HGFHIHENGSCDNAGNGAGGHFNPNNVKHGKLIVDGFDQAHAGDLGNILVAADGHGTLSQTVPGLTLSDGLYAIASRAVILHAQRDDFSQPVGNAGARIGCGTIDLVY
ncbi:MAG TPA: superoxide dismutase family protein, partial [Chroococcidiopsis sp.]